MIEVDRLSLDIHGAPILRDVSFALEAGRVLGLVGESGSGKSMTALSILRLLPQGAEMQGEVRLEGQRLGALSERQMCGVRGREIGMIFQEPMTALNPVQSIGDQVAETLIIHGAARRSEALARAKDRLARVGLAPDKFPLSRYPFELSGGQRQRVCIALAVALQPKLLIADEPTTALDVTTQAQILALVKELVAEDAMACLFITHDLGVVAQMADEIAVMQSGEIVERVQTGTLPRGLQHPYTRRLFAAATHVPPDHGRAPGDVLLRVTGVTREYALPRRRLLGPRPRFRAVDGVSFEVRAGEVVALVGESGSGKSTLARAVLGLDQVQGGAIELDGAPVGPEMAASARRRMQVVFQDPYGSFNPRHRVARLIAEPFHLGGVPEDPVSAVAQALEAVGLQASDAEKYPHEFSGGQRQRIALARALITRPDLIVLDEAVSALDVSVRARILDLLSDLQARYGLAYLFITHDLMTVRAIADRVMVMKDGQIVETGPTKRVFDAPEADYTKALFAAAPLLPAA